MGNIVCDTSKIPIADYKSKTTRSGWLIFGQTTVYQNEAEIDVIFGNGELRFECKTENGKIIASAAPRLEF